MSVALYMDHNISSAITAGLRLKGIDVITAFEDQSNRLDDISLLNRVIELNRVLLTCDDDFLAEANYRMTNSIYFTGIIYFHQQRISIGHCISDIEYLTTAGELTDFENNTYFLPL